MNFRPKVIFIICHFLLLLSCQAPAQPPASVAILPTANPTAVPPTQTLPAATAEAAAEIAEPTPTREPVATLEIQQRATIAIPMVVYILDDVDGEASSARTVEELEEIYERVNTIWSQADITIDVLAIERIVVPRALLDGFTQRDFFTFFNAVNQRVVELPQFAPIVGFYVKGLGGPNGIAPSNSNTFFVMDEPSVFDERVTSHEIGHILGLHHERDDAGRLMFSGTNGMELTKEEQTVARYAANGLLARSR